MPLMGPIFSEILYNCMGSLASGQFSVRQMEEKRFKSINNPYSEPSLKKSFMQNFVLQRKQGLK